MENIATEVSIEHGQEEQRNKHEVQEDTNQNEEQQEHVIKDDKSDSDDHSDDLNSNDEQNVNGSSSSNSQFYESSDSKLDYAIKIDDNDTLSDIDDIKTDSASADSEDSALGSLPPDTNLNEREEEVQERSDGSDSGLGSETADIEATQDVKLPNFNLDLPSTSGLNKTDSNIRPEEIENEESHSETKEVKQDDLIEQPQTPLRSNLKRKHEDENENEVQNKKKQKKISFDNVTVYYFPRAQGFSCVPSQGGSTLGMEWEHTYLQKFTLAEHALEQRRLHRQILQQLKSERHTLQGVSLSSSEDSDTEEEASDLSESELDLDNYFFLQPVPTRQRRALLRAAGVRKIEGYEKDECRDIRTSREFCGCACKGACNPESCSCSLAGIKCQVDRLNFPCGCTRDGCHNTTGRIEFNPIRVRTHFIHTLMRVGLEKKNEDSQEAAKRQWAQMHNLSTHQSCSAQIMGTQYEREHCVNRDDGLVRDVSLSPRVEVESCVNSGSFSNIHCNMTNAANHNSASQENMAYNYRHNNTNHLNMTGNNMHYDTSNSHRNHNDPYTSNILQGKGPPYPMTNSMGYDATNNVQQFDLHNYSYGQNTEHQYKGIHSYSANSFEEFAHNSHMNMFSHYGHMYMPDYNNMHKSSTTNVSDHNSMQYHSVAQSNYEVYKSSQAQCYNAASIKNESHYTVQQTPYQNSSKLSGESDENWFSHNTLMGLDHSDQTQDTPDAQSSHVEQTTENNNSDTTENFGELIKKTMVESVTV